MLEAPACVLKVITRFTINEASEVDKMAVVIVIITLTAPFLWFPFMTPLKMVKIWTHTYGVSYLNNDTILISMPPELFNVFCVF